MLDISHFLYVIPNRSFFCMQLRRREVRRALQKRWFSRQKKNALPRGQDVLVTLRVAARLCSYDFAPDLLATLKCNCAAQCCQRTKEDACNRRCISGVGEAGLLASLCRLLWSWRNLSVSDYKALSCVTGDLASVASYLVLRDGVGNLRAVSC